MLNSMIARSLSGRQSFWPFVVGATTMVGTLVIAKWLGLLFPTREPPGPWTPVDAMQRDLASVTNNLNFPPLWFAVAFIYLFPAFAAVLAIKRPFFGITLCVSWIGMIGAWWSFYRWDLYRYLPDESGNGLAFFFALVSMGAWALCLIGLTATPRGRSPQSDSTSGELPK